MAVTRVHPARFLCSPDGRSSDWLFRTLVFRSGQLNVRLAARRHVHKWMRWDFGGWPNY